MFADVFSRLGELHSPVCGHSGRAHTSPAPSRFPSYLTSLQTGWTNETDDLLAGRALNRVLALASQRQRHSNKARHLCKAAQSVLAEISPVVTEESFPRGAHWQVGLQISILCTLTTS